MLCWKYFVWIHGIYKILKNPPLHCKLKTTINTERITDRMGLNTSKAYFDKGSMF